VKSSASERDEPRDDGPGLAEFVEAGAQQPQSGDDIAALTGSALAKAPRRIIGRVAPDRTAFCRKGGGRTIDRGEPFGLLPGTAQSFCHLAERPDLRSPPVATPPRRCLPSDPSPRHRMPPVRSAASKPKNVPFGRGNPRSRANRPPPSISRLCARWPPSVGGARRRRRKTPYPSEADAKGWVVPQRARRIYGKSTAIARCCRDDGVGHGDAVTGPNYPYRGCLLIPRPHGQGWQVDLEINGELIPGIYTNSEPASKEQAVQEATKDRKPLHRFKRAIHHQPQQRVRNYRPNHLPRP
jgi:hypothetical protein